MKRETFISSGKNISVGIWDEVSEPRAVVQIAHGMSEHSARYDDFARFLNKNGYIVLGSDHRAHGQTDPGALGLAEDGDLFADTVGDLSKLTDWATARWNLPVIFFGHSYGSFLGQAYLLESSRKIVGCVLSGSASYGKALAAFGGFLANRKFKKHKDEPGNFFAKITFKSYDKKTGEGLNGWLSRDPEVSKKYNEDEFCGYTCSNGFYKWFFAGMKTLAGDSFVSVRGDLPLLLIYGQNDYVGGRGKLVKKLAEKYAGAGLKPEVKEYAGARHEVLNETNKEEVYSDVLKFFDTLNSH